jgi:aryl-alcohol dehydrogenase-like predicted oxidoreductase
MERRRFGKTGMLVSALGFGGAEIGFEKSDVPNVARLLNAALDAGLNVIDTAECYLQSEDLIGQAVATRRDDYYLFTKCGHPEKMGVDDWRPESILKSIERSCKRLKTDRLDLIQLHSCSEEELRKGDVVTALEQARVKGLTRFIGYSGDGNAARYAVEYCPFDVLQISINIADQQAIDLVMPLARERDIGVIAKRPIANAVWKNAAKPKDAYYQTYWEWMRKLDYDFLKGDPQLAVERALRFTLSVPGVHTAIVGTSKPNRWSENAALIASGPLPAEQFDAIRAKWRSVADETWVGQT